MEVADGEVQFEPAVGGSNGNFFSFLDKRKGAGVKAYTGGLEFPGFGLLTPFLSGFGHTGNGANNEVSMEAIFLLNSVVAKML